MNPPFVTERALANSYSSGSYKTAYERVVFFRKVQRMQMRHPNKGSQALATKLDVDRGRIREWVDGDSKPEPVQAIELADRRGWLATDYDAEAFPVLNRLIAWVFSGGSIDAERYVPLFVLNGSSDGAALYDDLNALDVGHQTERGDDTSPEVRPATDASVLGRVLSLLGAPVARKNRDADVTLPTYLDDAPDHVRADFVDVYLQNRAASRDESRVLNVREQRSDAYLQELAALFRDVSGESVSVSEQNVILSADATRALYGRLGLQRSSND